MPTFWKPGPTRKIVELDTVERSIGPENGTEIRGWTLKPSSVFSTSMSAQSVGRTAQFGLARSTRRPVACVASSTVYRLLGNAWPAVVAASADAGNASEAKATRRRRRAVRTGRTPLLGCGKTRLLDGFTAPSHERFYAALTTFPASSQASP